MAEEAQVDNKATDAVAEAKSIGWVDKAEFRGDPNKWVDAETYLQRGKDFIPFLRASNKKLESQVHTLQSELVGAKNLLRANEAALNEIKTTTAETAKAATEQEVVDLRKQIAAARREGDFEKEEELREQLDETKARLRQPPATAPKPPDFQNDPNWKQFVNENPWWDSDPVMRAASMTIAQQLANSGALNDLTPPQRFAKIAAETRKRFGDNPRRQEVSRVSETRNSSGGPEGGTTFNDLPADAKEACDNFAKNPRIVGPDKKFKTVDEYRANYAKTYFAGT